MRCIALLAILVCSGLASAQGPEGPSGREIQLEVEAEIARMRALLQAGKEVTTNVKVTVRLNNGNRLKGVVKNGRVVEKVDGLQFVAAKAEERGAGVRLWYHDDTDSFIFVPFLTIDSYSVGQQLTESQIAEIEKSIAEQRERNAKAREEYVAQRERERLAAQQGREGAAQAQEEARQARRAAEMAAEEARLLALLEEFPPEQGWGEERRRTIETLKVTAGVFPDEKGKRFLEIFGDWSRGLEIRTARENEPPPLPEIEINKPKVESGGKTGNNRD